MSAKDKQLQTKVEDEIKKYNTLKKAFSTIYGEKATSAMTRLLMLISEEYE